MQLRDYQIEAINALEQDLNLYPRSLLVLATGLGKTETIFGFCLRSLEKNPQTKILFLVNKVALVNQTAKRADPFFDVGIFCGSEKLYQTDKQLTVASIQSIHASGDYYDYIILDEVHRASATSYERFIENCTLRNPNVKVIGLTATPFNSNGYIYGDDKFFKSICYEKGLRWAIDNNWLVKPVLKHTEIAFDTASLHSKLGDFDLKEVKELTTNEQKVMDQIADAMPKLTNRKKIIWHCSCIEHAELVSSKIPEPSVVVHSKMNRAARFKAMQDFEQGECRHLVFVMIVSEGYDNPMIDTVVMMRPTRSPIVYVQSVGRALRLMNDKKDCLILDYAQVVRRCGPLDNPNVNNGTGRPKDYLTFAMKFCPKCYSYQNNDNAVCVDCGHDFIAEKLLAQKNRLKSLTRESDANAQILSDFLADTKIIINQKLTRISKYKAKSGNWCFRIVFYPLNALEDPIYKFIPVMDTAWTNKYVNDSLSKIICSEYKGYTGPLSMDRVCDEISSIGFNRVKGLIIEKKGKYKNIKGYIYVDKINESEKARVC